MQKLGQDSYFLALKNSFNPNHIGVKYSLVIFGGKLSHVSSYWSNIFLIKTLDIFHTHKAELPEICRNFILNNSM